MIKYYLIPAEITIEDGESSRNPKYMDNLKINWSGVYVESRDFYVIVTNESSDLTKFTELEKHADVISLDDSEKARNAIAAKLGIVIQSGTDLVELVARLQVSNFTKGKLSVVGK